MNYPPHLVTPNFVYRHFAFNAGEGYDGHRHAIDHPTIVACGAVRVDVDGEESFEVCAVGHFIAPKDREHKITAIEDGTVWLCVFTAPAEGDLRDFWNEV